MKNKTSKGTIFYIIASLPSCLLASELNTIDTYPTAQRPDAVYEYCNNSWRMVATYDCSCIKEQYLALSNTKKEADTQTLVSEAINQGNCRSEEAFAKDTATDCKNHFFANPLSMTNPNINKESYCKCVGEKAAKMFVDEPDGKRAASSTSQGRYKSLAMGQCRPR